MAETASDVKERRPRDVAELALGAFRDGDVPSGTIMFAALPQGRGLRPAAVVLRQLREPHAYAPHGEYVVHYWNVDGGGGDTYQGDYARDYAEAVALFALRVLKNTNGATAAVRAELARKR